MDSENSKLKSHLRVLIFSLFVSLVIMSIKWIAYFLSDSVALKTDALESFINIIAIIMAITAVYHAQRPADSNHPYGHGKIEYFSSAIEGGMLLLGSCYLLYESLQAWIYNHQAFQLNQALIYSAIGGIMNGALGTWQLHQGRKLQSEAIITDAKHLLADFYTTLGVLVGLVLAQAFKYPALDSVVAGVVSLILLKNSFTIIRNSALVLSDVEDPQLIDRVVDLLNSPLKDKDVIDIHKLRSFRSGKKNFIDLHVVVPEFWNVRQAHDETEKFCSKLKKELQQESEFHPHVEACMRKYCANCEVENCPIRMHPFSEKMIFTSESVVASSDDDDN